MKKFLIIVILLITSIVILFILFVQSSKSGKATGLIDGKLSKCPTKPNCVCSEQKDDTEHYIEPIIPRNTMSDTLKILKESIQASGGIIQTETDSYIAATFSSAVFGFVDDLEIRVDSTQNVIHIRSASRIGSSDFGVNRKRVESIKDLLFEKK